MELQPILHVWLNHDTDLVDLTITSQTQPPLKAGQHSEVVHTTQKHPFLTIEKGFLPVGQITLGMHVLRADGSIGTITGWKVVPGSATMYNLEVAQDHTYTVGDGLWIVHNCAGGADKLTPPDHPDGMNRNEFGKNVMKWGSGDAAARDRIATVTREEMEQGGVTKDMAKKWRDFYRGVMVKTPENPSAAGRADLMDHVYRLLGGTDD